MNITVDEIIHAHNIIIKRFIIDPLDVSIYQTETLYPEFHAQFYQDLIKLRALAADMKTSGENLLFECSILADSMAKAYVTLLGEEVTPETAAGKETLKVWREGEKQTIRTTVMAIAALGVE
jgi:hypothetical protein